MGKTEKYIRNRIEKRGAILLSLVDPDKQPFEKGAKVAEACCEAGSDVILVGGSIGSQGMILDKTVKMIRERVNIPIVLFNGHVTPFADAVYFMYIMNSRDTYWLSTGQIEAAPAVKKMGIEPIPTGYIIVEPGKTVGWLSNANLVPRNKPDIAAATALASEYMGARLIITDSGSGADSPAPVELIRAVKSQLNIPYFYAGGCRTAEQAREIIRAGADGIHVGTAFEIDDPSKVKEKVSSMAKAIREAGLERKKRPIRPKHDRSLLPMIRAPRWFKSIKRERLEEKLKKLTDTIPMGRLARPEDIIGTAIYLGSDASSFVTGVNIFVDGGRTID